jgi:Tol biopolymer transport system component
MTSQARRLAGLVALAAAGAAAVFAADSPSGTAAQASTPLVFARGSAASGGLYTLRTDRIRRLTSGQAEGPAWSPDGARIAFSSTRDRGLSYGIYVVPATGGRPRAITSGGGFAQSPSWSPDGSRIVFSASGGRFGQSRDRNCIPSLWVMRPDGSRLRRLMRAAVEPAYSPDGRRIAFVRPDARDRPWLFVAASSGSNARRIGFGAHPSWSPDGRRLVVERGVGLNRVADLWLVSVSGGHAARLTRTPSLSERGPAWSPDGRWIAFSMVKSGRDDIYVIPVSGGRPQAITNTGADGGNFDPAWRPNP